MDIIRRFGFIGAACFFMACSHQNAQSQPMNRYRLFVSILTGAVKAMQGFHYLRTILRQILKNILNGTRLMV